MCPLVYPSVMRDSVERSKLVSNLPPWRSKRPGQIV
jgi:hypothetical protein